MLLTISLAGLLLASDEPPTDRFFKELLHQREQFESVLRQPREYIGYTQVHSEMLGGAHGDALYPIGSAAERYIVYFEEAASGGKLIYEKRHGAHASVDWYVDFRSAKRKHAVNGTVRNYLKRLGFEISPKAHLTVAIRRQLSVRGYFANYMFHPMMGGYAFLVKPDGSRTQTRKGSDPFTITPEERDLLISRP